MPILSPRLLLTNCNILSYFSRMTLRLTPVVFFFIRISFLFLQNKKKQIIEKQKTCNERQQQKLHNRTFDYDPKKDPIFKNHLKSSKFIFKLCILYMGRYLRKGSEYPHSWTLSLHPQCQRRSHSYV